MAYNWAQLAFVEKWRLHAAVRGHIIGMYRPDDRTYFDLLLRPGEGNVGQIPRATELHLIDAGNLIREKRVVLMDKLAVVVRVLASVSPADRDTVRPAPSEGRTRRALEPGAPTLGSLVEVDGDILLLDVGFPVVVQLPEGEAPPPVRPGTMLQVKIPERPKGFIVL